MKDYILNQKTYIKSENNINKINKEYTISLIIFSILSIIINIFINKNIAFSLIKSLIISLVLTSIIAYIINIIKKEYNFLDIYKKDNIEQIAIILGLFAVNIKIYILVIAIIISVLIKKINKNITISSSLYGILIILIYKYYINNITTPLINLNKISYNIKLLEIIKEGGGILNYLFGIAYLTPVLSILVFIYLFHKKITKYSLIFSYSITFFIIMTIIGVLNRTNLWLGLFEILTGNTLFLITYTLADYKMTPTISEGNIIYGIILGILTTIMRFIIPELSLPIAFIISPFIFTNYIDKISPKLKYNNKLFIGTILLLSLITIIEIGIITLII